MKLEESSKAAKTNAIFNPGSLALFDGSDCTCTETAVETPLEVTWKRATLPIRETKSFDASLSAVCDSPT
ncbi:hypothetical protein C455_13937 [Haloferax larsenii JCM 13917]|nr:hypothetical protein [Haloferax larsenii]ELZ76895.1 hypothetical protein C455_13937 [Haloferax larsenii JCM 13917]